MTKTVLITGASSGFGKLTAKKFHKEGWNVVVTMRSPEEDQTFYFQENVLVTRLDVTDKESIENAVSDAIEEFGTIDVLVNNAGFGGHGFLEQFSEEQILKMFDTNVFGAIRVSQAVLPMMRKRKKGIIINVTSSAGYFGLPLNSTYCASKFAMEGLTESMALEYKPFNIAVKAVAPGSYTTNFTASTDRNIEKGDRELIANAQIMATHFAATAAQMQKLSGTKANPNEVANKIYECATTDAPVHNLCGADAQWMADLMKSMSRQDFLDQMEGLLTPVTWT